MVPDPQDNSDRESPDAAAPGDPEHEDSLAEPLAPPPPLPRPVTSIIRRRAFTEPRVWFWLLAALVLGAISAGFLINGLVSRAHESWLIEHGEPVNAMINRAGEESAPRRPQSPDTPVALTFRWHDKEVKTPAVRLPGRNKFVEVGEILQLHVNPKDPEDWTWLDEPLPLLNRAIGTVITAPMAALSLIWALIRRRRLIRIWQRGEAIEALVVEARPTAVNPRCRAAQVTPGDESDNRIFTVYLPSRFADVEPGEPIYILRRSPRSRDAVAAAWFET